MKLHIITVYFSENVHCHDSCLVPFCNNRCAELTLTVELWEYLHSRWLPFLTLTVTGSTWCHIRVLTGASHRYELVGLSIKHDFEVCQITQWLYSNYTVIMGSRSFKAQIVEEGILESIRIQTTQALQYWHVVHHEQALLNKEGSWYLLVSSAYLFLLMFSCLAMSDSLEPRSKVPQVGAQLLPCYFVERMYFCVVITTVDWTVGFQIWKFINYLAGNCMYYGTNSCVLLYVKLKWKWSAPAFTKYKHTTATRTTRPSPLPFIHEVSSMKYTGNSKLCR